MTSHDKSSLYIWVCDFERFEALRKSMTKDYWDEVYETIEIKPGAFGIFLDVKLLLKTLRER
ncbi:hypothetical protein JYT20_01195 [Rhodothermus sp. AH-315-K08]|nr:hypothetical protein [Rhodothermus sp. AH-315-K08]